MEATIEKLDLSKVDKTYYKAKKNPALVDLDSYYYLTVSGKSSPESPEFQDAIEKLYSVAYSIKFICKAEDMDFVMPKMEGYWWIDGGFEAQSKFTQTPRDEWNWRIAIRMPDFVEGDHFYRAIRKLESKGKSPGRVKYELLHEGLSVQILHIGSYENEEGSILKVLEFIKSNGLEINGYHHEIYLNDPRKTSEDRLKTILRYAVKKNE